MTLEEFLARLSKTPRKWDIIGQRIRMQDPDGHWSRCPITSLTGEALWEWGHAAIELGLPADLAKHIANAADYRNTGFKRTRKLLLEACGLPHDVRAYSLRIAREELQSS